MIKSVLPMKLKTTTQSRTGTTLTEILVALGIMATGVAMVASLFPATIAQAIRATQLTHATMLRHEAVQQVKLHNGLEPDFTSIHAGKRNGNVDIRVIDPLGYWTDPSDNTQYNTNHDSTFGPVRRVDGGFGQQYLDQTPDPSETPQAQQTFGLASAKATTISGDSWVTDFTEIAESTSTTQIDFPNETTTTNALTTANEMVTSGITLRLLIEDADGKNAYSRIPTTINATNIVFAPALPTGVTAGKVRLQHFEERYSWMITSRSEKSASEISEFGSRIVVFFRRDFSPLSEKVYNTTRNGPSLYTITWAATDDKPLVRRGGHLFDPDNGFWYQIQDILDETNSTNVKVLLDSKRKGNRTPTRFMIPNGVIQTYLFTF